MCPCWTNETVLSSQFPEWTSGYPIRAASPNPRRASLSRRGLPGCPLPPSLCSGTLPHYAWIRGLCGLGVWVGYATSAL